MTSPTATEAKRLTRIFKALANEHRLSLYLRIWQQQQLAVLPTACFVNEWAAKLQIGAPTVSHHVKELEAAGLIVTQRVGKQLTATIDPATHAFVLAQLGH